MECDEYLKVIHTLANEIVREITVQSLRHLDSGVIVVYCRRCHGDGITRTSCTHHGAANRQTCQTLTCDAANTSKSEIVTHYSEILQNYSTCHTNIKLSTENQQDPETCDTNKCVTCDTNKCVTCDTNKYVTSDTNKYVLREQSSSCTSENLNKSVNVNTVLEPGHDTVHLSDTFFSTLLHDTDVRARAQLTTQQSKKVWRKAKKEKQMRKKLKGFPVSEQPLPTYEEMGFWTESDITSPTDSNLLCPVCMELYYKPHSCMPCEHVFCEPCLRRMAKYNADNRMDNVCPVCRQQINHCVPNAVKLAEVQTSHGYAYNKRHKCEFQGRYMSHPLPARTVTIRREQVLNAVTHRQRVQYYRQIANNSKLKKTCYILVIFSVIMLSMFVVSHLLLWCEHECVITRRYVQFCSNLWNYNALEYNVKLAVTNEAVIGLALCLAVGSLLYFLI